MKKSICILSFSNIEWDSRVQREIHLARTHFNVDVIGYGNWNPPEGVCFIKLIKMKKGFVYKLRYYLLLILGRIFPKCYDFAFWLNPDYKQAVDEIIKTKYQVLHANDWDSMPVADLVAKLTGCRVLFDAHEYTPEQGAEDFLIRLFVKPYRIFLFKHYSRNIAKFIDASDRYSVLYHENFGWESTTVYNAAIFRKMPFNPARQDCIRIIHHGFAMPGRFLEEMIIMMELLDDRFQLHMMLVSNTYPNYMKWLKSYAQKKALNRVIFINPVPPNEIIEKINAFDIGLPFMKVRQLSQYNSQPNKLFDYIMAGLAVITPPLPGIADIVSKNNIGKVSASQSGEDMASMLNALSVDEINTFKRNSLKLARVFNAEREMGKLLHIYQSLLPDNSTQKRN